MADRVLPSRELIESYVSEHGPRQEYPSLAPIIDAYVSGRLVDREAIDYEAGWEQVPSSRPLSPSRFRFAVDVAVGLDHEAVAKEDV